MPVKLQNGRWYFFLLFTAFLMVYAALGPGLHRHAEDGGKWFYVFFSKVCHQDPARSYSLNGVPMAVCSRCFGIYSSFAMGLAITPLLAWGISLTKKAATRILAVAILLNTVDVVGNLLGLWTNTINSRFLLGVSIGLATTILLRDIFFNQLNKTENINGTE